MQTVNLQGIGKHAAKQASCLKSGDVIVWNYGQISAVVNVEIGEKTVTVQLEGNIIKKFRSHKMVAVQ